MLDITGSTGHKKQSLNTYHFLGLSGNLYIIIELNRSNRTLRVGCDGNVGWEANLPACHIFRRGIDVYSSSLLRLDRNEVKFVQLFPPQVPHAAKQSIPCFLHEQPSGSNRQIYNCTSVTISNKDARAAGGTNVLL